MSLLTLNGIAVPVAVDTLRLGDRIVGGDRAADDGSLHRARAAFMDELVGSTRLLGPDEALVWRGLLNGRGHRWAFDTDPGVTTTNPSAALDRYSSRGLLLAGTASRRQGYVLVGASAGLGVQSFGSDAHFDQAAAIEAAATNLFPANVRRGTDASSNTTGFTASGATLSSSTTYAFEGSRSLKVACAAASQGFSLSGAGKATGAASTKYVVSFYLRASIATDIDAEVSDSNGGSTTVTLTVTTGWRRYAIAHQTGAPGSASPTIDLSLSSTEACDFYVDAFQCESGKSVTSWVGAGSGSTELRSLGSLVANLGDLRRQDDLTIMGWFKGPHFNLYDGVKSATDAVLWTIGDDNSNGVYLKYNGTSGLLELHFFDAGVDTTIATSATSFGPADTWHHVAAVVRRAPMTNNKATLYVDGVDEDQTSLYDPPTIEGASISVGGFGDGSSVFNGLVDEFVVLPYALRTSDVEALYASRFSNLPRLHASGDVLGGVDVEVLGSVTADGMRFTFAADPTAGLTHRNASLAFRLQQAER